MALINCPECKSEVSDKAKQCPKCAFPFDNQNPKPKETVVVAKEGFFLRSLNTGCLVIIGIVLGIIILFVLFSSIS